MSKLNDPEFRKYVSRINDAFKDFTPAFKPIDDKKLIEITQTVGISDFLYNIRNVTKNGKKVEVYDYEKDEHQTSLIYTTKEKGEITLTGMNDENPPVFTDNHIKLIIYMLWKDHVSTSERFQIKYDEFFALKGIEDNKKNRMDTRKQIKEIDSVFFDYRKKVGRKTEWLKKVRLMTVWELNRTGITVQLGSWKQEMPKETFIQVHKAIFGYDVNRGIAGATNISLKLRDYQNIKIQEYRKKKKAPPKKIVLGIKHVLDTLEISEQYLKNKGVNISSDRLEKYLGEIEQREGLVWEYRNGEWTNYKDFMSDYIEYSYR